MQGIGGADDQFKPEVARGIVGFGDADKRGFRGNAVGKAAAVCAGDIGALQRGHELFAEVALGVEKTCFHGIEDLLAQENIALDGVIRTGDVIGVRQGIRAGEAYGTRRAGGVKVGDAVLAVGGIAKTAEVCPQDAVEDLLGAASGVHHPDHAVQVEVRNTDGGLRIDRADARHEVVDDDGAAAASAIRGCQAGCACGAHLTGRGIDRHDGKGMLCQRK